MKNKILMSTVAIALAFSFCLPALNTTYALYTNCDKLNKDGQFDNEDCAVMDSLEKISNSERFIKLNNVGHKSEYDLLFFDSSEINGVLSNLTYNKDINQLISMKEQQLEKSNEAISGVTLSLGLGKVLKNIYEALNFQNEKKEQRNRGFMQLAANPRLIIQAVQNAAIVIPIGISALIASLVCAANSYFRIKAIDNLQENTRIERNNYFYTLRMILDSINNNQLDNNKLLYLRLKSSPAIVSVLDKKISKTYTQEEKNKFNNDVLKLKEEITSILTEANKLRGK